MMSPRFPTYPKVLKRGTRRLRGIELILQNIFVGKAVAELVSTSIGPRGMAKLIVDKFGKRIVTKDGSLILRQIEFKHPVSKMMVEVARAQEFEIGDGTKTLILLIGSLLSEAEELIRKGIHPSIIIDGYKKAAIEAIKAYKDLSLPVSVDDADTLRKIIRSMVLARLPEPVSEIFSDLAIEVFSRISTRNLWNLTFEDIRIQEIRGGTFAESRVIDGFVIDKEIVHPHMPKIIHKAKIAILSCPLEVKKSSTISSMSKVEIENTQHLRSLRLQGKERMKEEIKKLSSMGINFLVCQEGIDEYAQFLLAKEGIAAIRRVPKRDLERLVKVVGGKIISDLRELSEESLGKAELVEERVISDMKVIFIEGCGNSETMSVMIRGPADEVIADMKHCLRDMFFVLKNLRKEGYVTVGGGASDIEVVLLLCNLAEKELGKNQLIIEKFARAIESIPRQLAENSGLDSLEIISKLKAAHNAGEKYIGIDAFTGKLANMYELGIFEPTVVKEYMIKFAVEIVNMILKSDEMLVETIKDRV
ncbi:MAG: thermosome subunit beta [Candidatus Bathyarchaeia archaeon]